jgi:hypothetical protein
MPSSYTPNLRLVLPVQGELTGNWGTTVNNGLTSLVDAAIAGTATVSMTDANYTLTAANEAADEARQMFIRLTGTLSTTRNVICPAVSKLYFVSNETTGGQSIVFKTAAGTGITVPNGSRVSLYCDGTNVVRAANDIGTVKGESVTQAFGNNTTAIATTAFVQAALQALHPVGSVYINATNPNNPATYFGFGTWVAFGAGRVPVGFDASDPLFDTAEETGGSKDAIVVSHTHTLSGTTESSGSHNHIHGETFQRSNVYGTGGTTQGWEVFANGQGQTRAQPLTSTAGTHTHTLSGNTASTGSSGTNANLQPYITVYLWKRTA